MFKQPIKILFGNYLSDTEGPFFGVGLPVTNDIDSSKFCDGRDGFQFEIIVGFPFLGGAVTRVPSCGVYFLHLIRFPRMLSNVSDFMN